MERQIQSVFPTLICYGKMDNAPSFNQQIISDSFVDINNFPLGVRSGVGVEQSRLGLERHYVTFSILSKKIHEFAKPYITENRTKADFAIQNMWVNVNSDPSAFHLPHVHSFKNSVFSGVYFPTNGIHEGTHIDTQGEFTPQWNPHPEPGSLVLVDPGQIYKTGIAHYNQLEKYPYWGSSISFTPQENGIILFPSYLQHLVTPIRKKDFVRISIAFDIQFEE